jgi:hypothetical protein
VLLALPIWTLFVWGTRLRIIFDTDQSRTTVIVPIVLTVLAIAAFVDRRRGIAALAAATIVVWVVRLPLVLVHDHDAGFKAVHAVLAVVSLALSYGALRAARPQSSGCADSSVIGTSSSPTTGVRRNRPESTS